MKIRPFLESDEPAAARLWRDVFPDVVPHAVRATDQHNHPETDIRRKLAIQRELFLVATIGSELVGTAMAGYDGHRGWVYYLVVHPGRRRQGIGRALMAEVERRLERMSCPKLNLQVRASNQQVVSFYRKLGYEVEERISMGKRLAKTRGGT